MTTETMSDTTNTAPKQTPTYVQVWVLWTCQRSSTTLGLSVVTSSLTNLPTGRQNSHTYSHNTQTLTNAGTHVHTETHAYRDTHTTRQTRTHTHKHVAAVLSTDDDPIATFVTASLT